MDDRHEEQEGEYGPLPGHGVGLGREVGLGSRCDADGRGIGQRAGTEFTARTL